MTLLEAILLGIVEGLTEFLPVSSTGHLVLASHLLGVTQTEFAKTFEISIQVGAMGAVMALYAKMAFRVETMKRVLAGFLPTAAIGFVLYKFIKEFLLGNPTVTLWSFFLGGILLIVFERVYRPRENAARRIEDISIVQAFWIGVIQSLAIIPGVSRAGATILGGMGVGVSRKTAVEFSFLLAMPTLAAAAALDLFKTAPRFTAREAFVLAIGAAVSFAVARLAIRAFFRFTEKSSLAPFGWYRIAVAIAFWWFHP